jgi:hypothetical protein
MPKPEHKCRIFLGLIEIAGHYRALTDAFRQLGHKATFVDMYGNRNCYESRSRNNLLLHLIDYLVMKRQKCRGRWAGRAWRALLILLQPLLFVYAVCTHDVFILGHNTTFMGPMDLCLLKLCGKRIIAQFHGTDGRLRYIDAYFQNNAEKPDVTRLARHTRKQRRIIRSIDRWADVVVNIGPQGHLHTRPFVQWLRVGLPSSQSRQPMPSSDKRDSGAPVRILHCPSNPIGKGTAIIRNLVAKAREIRSIEYVEVIGQPNSVVMDELRKCDFVIDQVYADYGMAGFATEAAWLGKPALVGGLAVDYWKQELCESLRPPSLYCYPKQMYEMMLKLIDDEEFRLELGRKARAFVESSWHPIKVAQKLLLALDNKLSPDWYVEAADISYIAGWGMPPERLKDIVSRMVRKHGIESLCVGDKPKVQSLFERLINGQPLPPETGLADLTRTQ